MTHVAEASLTFVGQLDPEAFRAFAERRAARLSLAYEADQATATGELTGTLELLGADGAVLNTLPVSIDAASTGVWDLKDIASDPSQVTGLELMTDGGPVAASWALVATTSQPDGTLVSVLLPAPVATGATSVAVRQDATLGNAG